MAFLDRYIAADGLVVGINVLSVFFEGVHMLLDVDVSLGPAIGVLLNDLHDVTVGSMVQESKGWAEICAGTLKPWPFVLKVKADGKIWPMTNSRDLSRWAGYPRSGLSRAMDCARTPSLS
jgi:hypothetical protein